MTTIIFGSHGAAAVEAAVVDATEGMPVLVLFGTDVLVDVDVGGAVDGFLPLVALAMLTQTTMIRMSKISNTKARRRR